MESPIKMDDLGVPLFSETSLYVRITFTIHKSQPKKKHIPRLRSEDTVIFRDFEVGKNLGKITPPEVEQLAACLPQKRLVAFGWFG